MDSLGLPIAFGKQTLPSKPTSPAAETSTSSVPRGEPSTRGSRGIVGGGKRKRGRGNQPISAEQQAKDEEEAKRASYAARQPLPPQSSYGYEPAYQPPSRGRGGSRGGRGGTGGGHGGRGENGGETHGGPQGGFYKESFCEDPWKQLMEARARRRSSD